MQIAFLVEGKQCKADYTTVEGFVRVAFTGDQGYYWPARRLGGFEATGWLDIKRGKRLVDFHARPWVNPQAPSEWPSPAYLWFKEQADAASWLRCHGYRPLCELTVSEPEA